MSYRLSLFQRVALQAEKIKPGYLTNPRSTLNIVVEVTGPLATGPLDAALSRLAARHETLRCRPLLADDTMEIVPPRAVAFTELAPGGDAEADLALIAAAAGETQIDVTAPPLVRGLRLSASPDRHLIGLVFHHVAVDPASLRLAVTELARLYEAELSGTPVPPETFTYGDYARWQSERLGARFATDDAAWAAALEKVTPTRYRRAAPFSPGAPVDGQVVRTELLSPDETDAVFAWSRRHRSTPFTTMLTAYASVLRDQAESDDLMLATAFEQRDHPQARRLIGPFVYPTLLPLTIRAGDPWEQLAGVRGAVIDAYDRAQFPLMRMFMKAPQLLPGTQGAEPSWFRMFEYLPSHDTHTYTFADAPARVVHSAGSQAAQNLFGVFLRVRRTPEGALVGRMAYDANDVTSEDVHQQLDGFRERLVRLVGAPVAG
jgi:hypothetical protein